MRLGVFAPRLFGPQEVGNKDVAAGRDAFSLWSYCSKIYLWISVASARL